ncbi:hypothetical protein FB552_1048 [Stenotrophomonas maltophilia]|nr:hypothetical protein FB552_1048 [Stenotrophomonas maltophilia]
MYGFQSMPMRGAITSTAPPSSARCWRCSRAPSTPMPAHSSHPLLLALSSSPGAACATCGATGPRSATRCGSTRLRERAQRYPPTTPTDPCPALSPCSAGSPCRPGSNSRQPIHGGRLRNQLDIFSFPPDKKVDPRTLLPFDPQWRRQNRVREVAGGSTEPLCQVGVAPPARSARSGAQGHRVGLVQKRFGAGRGRWPLTPAPAYLLRASRDGRCAAAACPTACRTRRIRYKREVLRPSDTGRRRHGCRSSKVLIAIPESSAYQLGN